MYKQSIELGPIELQFVDIESLSKFYIEVIGLKIISQTDESVLLGDGDHEILKLIKNENSVRNSERGVGLYHMAIVFPTQARLAKTILNLFQNFPELVEGSADHLVSEAFYFHDPSGTGIELYFDRPREDWTIINDRPQMGSIYIDPNEYINSHISGSDNLQSLRLGHIHLKVSSIVKANKFYIENLFLNEILSMPTALFVSYDGYHHHFGMNTWESLAAPELNSEFEGLQGFTINYLNSELFSKIVKQLNSSAIKFVKNNNEITIEDPFNIQIKLILKT